MYFKVGGGGGGGGCPTPTLPNTALAAQPYPTLPWLPNPTQHCPGCPTLPNTALAAQPSAQPYCPGCPTLLPWLPNSPPWLSNPTTLAVRPYPTHHPGCQPYPTHHSVLLPNPTELTTLAVLALALVVQPYPTWLPTHCPAWLPNPTFLSHRL